MSVFGKMLLTGALALGAGMGEAAARDVEGCHALRNAAIDGGFVTSARIVAASETLPEYCEVRATALPAISIELRLPVSDWNGRLYQTGCGGFCGILGRADASGGFINAMGPGLVKGYATATSDSGHHGMSVLDADWASANPNAERDWGWRSIGETNRVARAMVAEFYGDEPGEAIFQGCSTGGRMAHMASLRYPEMFAGIISGAPAMDYTGLVGTKMAWIVAANTGADGEPILGPGKDALVGDAVMAQCDEEDGTEDGSIADPRACSVDLSALRCGAEGGGNQCLTDAELDVIGKWRQGPADSDGKRLYPGGVPEGSEPFWWLWLTGNAEGGGKLVPTFATNFGAFMAFERDDPAYDPADFDFDADPARMAAKGALYNADDPDISAFREAGGKMLVWHGWADAIVTPYKTVDWHERATEAAGGARALAGTVSLHMVPGMDHCGILPGPGGVSQKDIDPLTALEGWMETGEPPETILK